MIARVAQALRAVRAARMLAGMAIDAGLDKFAKHICATRPGNVAAPNSTAQGDNGIKGYVIADATTGEPYMTRILFPRVFGIRPMLHHIHRPDYDRDLHDHPWDRSVSIILRGSYDEERPAPCHHDDCMRTVSRRVRWFNVIRASDWHRISKLHGNVWTLFITGERVQPWGFRRWDVAREEWVKIEASAYRKPDKRPTLADIATASGEDLTRLARDWYGIERGEFALNEGSEPVEESDSDLRDRLWDETPTSER